VAAGGARGVAGRVADTLAHTIAALKKIYTFLKNIYDRNSS